MIFSNKKNHNNQFLKIITKWENENDFDNRTRYIHKICQYVSLKTTAL